MPPRSWPAPTYRPTVTAVELATCERLRRRPTARQAQVERARLALLLHAQPDLDTAAGGRRLGQHVNWVVRWRHAWATAGCCLTDQPGTGARPLVPPLHVATVKALACEVPAQRDEPGMSLSTIWRLLDQDALVSWRRCSWITPRAPLSWPRRSSAPVSLTCGDTSAKIQHGCATGPTQGHRCPVHA